MPRILEGQIAAGVASTGVSVNNALVAPRAGGTAWRGPGVLEMNGPWPLEDPAGIYRLLEWRPGVGVRPFGDPAAADPGADVIAAGAGVLAAGLRRTPAQGGAFTRLWNDGGAQRLEGLVPWDVDRETGTAVLEDHQEGATLRVWTRDNGTATPSAVIPTGPLYGARCLGNRLIWTESTPNGLKPRAIDLGTGHAIPLTVRKGNCYQPLIVSSASGGLFVLYSGQEGAVWCHPADDPTRGHYLPDGPHYGLDGERQPAGALLAAWATNAGESAGSVQTVSWALEQLEALPADVLAVPRVGRPLWLTWFCHARGPNVPAVPSNCDFYYGPGADGYIRTKDGRPIVQYVTAAYDSDMDLLDAAIAAAKARDPIVPVLAYCTRQGLANRRPKDPNIVRGLEGYRGRDETMPDFVRRMRQGIEDARRVWMIGLCYTSNATNSADLEAVVPVYAQLAIEYPGIFEGVANFSGPDRPTGYQDHPEVHPAWEAFAAGVTVPALADPAPSPEPAPRPAPDPHPTPQPAAVPVFSSGGILIMAPEIRGTLYYYGTKAIRPGFVALFADPEQTKVFSAHGDTRAASEIKGWETWKLGGQLATAKVDAEYWSWIAIDVSGL